MTVLSTWARQIEPSPTLAIDAKAKKLAAEGHSICNLSAGEPEVDSPDFVKEACIEALKEGKTKYLPAAGLMPLREALAKKFREENGIKGLDASQIIVSPGGKFSCYVSILSCCSPGDEVIIPSPYWVSYPEMVKLAGAKPVIIETDEAFILRPDALRAAITPKTRMLILNSPSNPTGIVYTKEEIQALCDLALEKDFYILSDEIYEYLTYEGRIHYSPAALSPELASRVFTVGGFSKTFSMTGWRLGVTAAPEPFAQAIIALQSQTTSNATSFAQYGALAALEQKESAKAFVEDLKGRFNRRRKELMQALRSLDTLDCKEAYGAFYLFADISKTGLGSTAFASKLLDEAGVAVVPGIAFGRDHCVRISYATSDAILAEGISRIRSFCNKH